MAQTNHIGRRKTSTARVYMKAGNGTFTVNGKEYSSYFELPIHQKTVMQPLDLTETNGKYDITVTVRGGGKSGQADAVKLGIARALDHHEEGVHPTLKQNGLLTRDDRMVERKKYGQPKARKQFQFSKR